MDEAHTYFVGDGQWLVHNSCPPIRNNNNDQIIQDTLNNRGKGDINLNHQVTEDEALDLAIQWLGNDYRQIDYGVYRSNTPNVDGTYNQFRMDDTSLAGSHAPGVPHVHLEIIGFNNRGKVEKIVNNHIALIVTP